MCMGSGGAPGKCCGKLAGNMVEELESKEVVKPSSNGAESGAYNRSQLPELLKVYYRWLFLLVLNTRTVTTIVIATDF